MPLVSWTVGRLRELLAEKIQVNKGFAFGWKKISTKNKCDLKMDVWRWCFTKKVFFQNDVITQSSLILNISNCGISCQGSVENDGKATRRDGLRFQGIDGCRCQHPPKLAAKSPWKWARPQKENQNNQPSIFRGEDMLVSGRVNLYLFGGFKWNYDTSEEKKNFLNIGSLGFTAIL